MADFTSPRLADDPAKSRNQKSLNLWKWTYDAKTTVGGEIGGERWTCYLQYGGGAAGDTEWEACYRAAKANGLTPPNLFVSEWPQVFHYPTKMYNAAQRKTTYTFKVRRDGTDKGRQVDVELDDIDLESGHYPKPTYSGQWIEIADYPLLAHKLGIGT